MNDIGQRDLEAVLTARAESLEPGTAPVDAVLAGARRRGTRRRIATATAGVLAVTGVAVEVSTIGGSGGPTAVSVGMSPKPPVPTHRSMASPGPGTSNRQAPTVTQQAVAVSDPQAFRKPVVFATGTVDGKPWKMIGTEGSGGPFYDPKGELSMEHGYSWLAQLWIGDTLTVQCGGVSKGHDDAGGHFCSSGTNQVTSAFGFVDAHAVSAVWTGPDGLRYSAVPLATAFSGLKLVVFPLQVAGNPHDAVVVDPAEGGLQTFYVDHFSDGFEPLPTRSVETMPTRINPSHS